MPAWPPEGKRPSPVKPQNAEMFSSAFFRTVQMSRVVESLDVTSQFGPVEVFNYIALCRNASCKLQPGFVSCDVAWIPVIVTPVAEACWSEGGSPSAPPPLHAWRSTVHSPQLPRKEGVGLCSYSR